MSDKPTLNIVLVEPRIPQNTGNVARTCACTACRLHLVGPMGFAIDDRKLKHAGLPEALLAANQEHCIRMPMRDTCRSLNLSNSVAVGVYEVLRQWDFPELLDHGHLRDYEWK